MTSAAERTLKLLQASHTGLPEGLGERAGLPESALSELGIAMQAIVAEARLLAQPVSLELVSTTQAEGIEDRTTTTGAPSPEPPFSVAGCGRRPAAVRFVSAAVSGRGISLRVLDVSGRQIASLVEEVARPGYRDVSWDPRSPRAPRGLYFATLRVGEEKLTRTIVLLD